MNPETFPKYGHVCYHFDAANGRHASAYIQKHFRRLSRTKTELRHGVYALLVTTVPTLRSLISLFFGLFFLRVRRKHLARALSSVGKTDSAHLPVRRRILVVVVVLCIGRRGENN